MKFVWYEKDGVKQAGILSGDGTRAAAVSDLLGGKQFESMVSLVREISDGELELLRAAAADGGGSGPDVAAGTSGTIGRTAAAEVFFPVSEIRVLAPIEHPIHDVICVGVNYKDHLEESRASSIQFKEAPKKPVYFGKRALRILGPGEKIRARLDIDEELDYEVELAVIIGKTGRDIPREKAEEYIFGYSVFNDLSSRSLQRNHVQWFRGKSLDTYTAMGPAILHKSALPFPVEVDVISRVNGEERQHSNTRLFLTDIPSLIADLSAGMTLEAGDIIATGTPAGVGMGFKPGRFMKRGDEVACEIPQIGCLVNVVE